MKLFKRKKRPRAYVSRMLTNNHHLEVPANAVGGMRSLSEENDLTNNHSLRKPLCQQMASGKTILTEMGSLGVFLVDESITYALMKGAEPRSNWFPGLIFDILFP